MQAGFRHITGRRAFRAYFERRVASLGLRQRTLHRRRAGSGIPTRLLWAMPFTMISAHVSSGMFDYRARGRHCADDYRVSAFSRGGLK